MMQRIIYLFLGLLLISSCSGGEEKIVDETKIETHTVEENIDNIGDTGIDIIKASTSFDFLLEAWGDNWFSIYNNGELIVEDSVSIYTEKSFNNETKSLSASYPLELAFILKDYKENDSGLEYIGEKNQQIGDGGFIMQITDQASGEIVAVSDDSMKCIVIHTAPLDKTCEKGNDISACGFESFDEPDNWKLASFNDSSWDNATIHSAADVGPKEGYNSISWDDSAELIWGPNLETNNTVLCKLRVENPSSQDISDTESPLNSEIEQELNINVFSKFPEVSISSDDEFMYISHETGIPDHQMMVGITNWQQQVPILQNYSGNNSWSIPLHPVFSDENLSTTQNSFLGAIAVGVNGIPIFTALNNRGEDALDIGELDEFGGHSGRADDYHYHIPPVHLEEIVGEGEPIAYALDGYPIYGETDEILDEHFGILNEDGSYQYHTDLGKSPYFIPTFKGDVNYNGTQITPQAKTIGVRPATDPLRGTLEITNFTTVSDSSYSLSYEYESEIYAIDYSWNEAGEYVFVFTSPTGEVKTENYSSSDRNRKN